MKLTSESGSIREIYINMLPYGIVFVLLSLNSFLNRKSTIHFNLVVFISFLLLYSLRNNVGSDWSGYEFYFNNVNDKRVVDQFDFEVGYWLLNYLTSKVLNSYRYLVFLVGILVGILYWKATKRYSKNIGIVMLLSLFYLFYPTLEAFRQSITLFLFYYSLEYIEKNKKKYFLLNLIGFLFHRTGIFAFLFFVFNKYKIPKIVLIVSLLLFGILEPYIFNVIRLYPTFAMKYAYYFHSEVFVDSTLSFKSLEYLIIIIGYFIASRWKSINEYGKVWMNLVLLGFILQITLGQFSDIIYRITYYTNIGVIYSYVLIYDNLKSLLAKYLFIVVLISYVLLRFYRVFPFDDPRFIYSL